MKNVFLMMVIGMLGCGNVVIESTASGSGGELGGSGGTTSTSSSSTQTTSDGGSTSSTSETISTGGSGGSTTSSSSTETTSSTTDTLSTITATSTPVDTCEEGKFICFEACCNKAKNPDMCFGNPENGYCCPNDYFCLPIGG